VDDALVGAAAEMSPTSEKMSLSSAYRLLALKSVSRCQLSLDRYLIAKSDELTSCCLSSRMLDSEVERTDALLSACSHSMRSDSADVAGIHD
jgi:hypothetical protein